jgi:Spy/CpxP family protein refolding chaperone
MKKTLIYKLMITLAFVLIFQTQVYSQPQGHPPMPPPDCLERLQKDLNLTDIQLEKVKIILDEQKKEIDKVWKASEDERTAMHELMITKKKEADKKIVALLDNKQKEKFTEMQNQQQEISNEHRRSDRPWPHERHHMSREDRPLMPRPMSQEEHIAMLKDELNLTDSQFAKVKEIFSGQEKEMQKHQEFKQENPQALHEGMIGKRKEIDGKITAILNAEQKQKYEELVKKECDMLRDQHKPFEGDK